MRQLIKKHVKMKKLDVKKLTKQEIEQIALIRKFDRFKVDFVHCFTDGSVIISFSFNGVDFDLSVLYVSSYVRTWIKEVWLQKLNKSKDFVVYDYVDEASSELDALTSETDYEEF